MFLIEIKRAFSRLSFKIAISIGMIFCILSLLEVPKFQIDVLRNYIKGFVTTPFDYFILFKLGPLTNLLIIIIPIISTLSYSDSYIEDVRSGIIKSIYTREKKYRYLISKYFANFIVSGIAVSIPLLINYIVLILIYPSVQPNPMFGNAVIRSGNLFANFFYTHSNLYIIMWIIIYFLYSGAFASIALCCSTFLKNKFIVLFIPFIMYILVEVFAELSNKMQYSPQCFLYLSTNQSFYVILVEFILIFAGTICLYLFRGLKDEVY